MNIYLDIETLPTDDEAIIAEIAAGVKPPGNMSKPETIAAWERDTRPALVQEAIDKTALGPVVPPHIALGPVLCIGIAVGDDEPRVVMADDREAEAIMDVSEIIDSTGSFTMIVGHNVREFDLRYLTQRSAILGLVNSKFRIDDEQCTFYTFDTMTTWTGHYTRRVSLDWLCRIFKVPGKDETDGIGGADVACLYRAGEVDRIAEYCKNDVERVRHVYKRMTLQEEWGQA